MSVREQIAEKCRAYDEKESQLRAEKERLQIARVNFDNIETQYDSAKREMEEYEESVSNLDAELSEIDDEITDLKEAREESPV